MELKQIFQLKKEGIFMKTAVNKTFGKTMKFILAFGLMTGLTAVSAQAKNRYLVIYKSQQGHQAMESLMQSEWAGGYGFTQSLKHINGMVLQTADQRVIEQLRSHPEIAVVEAEFFTPTPKPANGFKLNFAEKSRRPSQQTQ